MKKPKIKKESMLNKKIGVFDFDHGDRVALADCISALYAYAVANPTIQGVSANQLNYNVRACLCKVSGKFVLMVNPEVIWQKGSKKSLEGCESLGAWRYIVKRSRIGKVVWYTADGIRKTKILLYKEMRRFQHELDHLDGKLLCDCGQEWAGNTFIARGLVR